jgi:23S rRNA (adenine1618-N6)-methyltransferase
VEKKIDIPIEKQLLHARNKHRELYNFEDLIKSQPTLKQYVHLNKYQRESINFHDPNAVLALNTALLKHFYGIAWDIPKGYLCPPIPGRADYIHYVADLLRSDQIPVRCLDIGVGANCVYPIIGIKEYDWSFVGTDIDAEAIENVNNIIRKNPTLATHLEVRHQKNVDSIFKGVLIKDEYFDISICNPPFHSSLEEAQKGTKRKLSNLKSKKINQAQLNFGGQQNELWRKGGELKFINDMIHESTSYKSSILWFTSLVSKKSNLKSIYYSLKMAKVKEVKTIKMDHGNKQSRIVAWTFHGAKEQEKWARRKT